MIMPDRPPLEPPEEPPARPRKPHFRLPLDRDEEEPVPTFNPLDPDHDLPGAVFMVPNEQWEIDSTTSTDHPGACVHYQERPGSAILVKGTDAVHVRNAPGYYVVEPTPENGLDKPTAFELMPRYFRLHKVRLFYPQRYLGRLDDATLFALFDELARACADADE
jgi:hypothetical protein